MDWESVLYRWQLYSKKLYPLRDEVDDIFETKCFYDEHWQYHERPYIPDDDTVFLLKLSEKLNDICDFVKSHISVLEHRVDIEEDIRANLKQAFEAWKRGLCPILMKSVPRYMKSNSWNFWETYDEIAFYLKGSEINYTRTQEAINLWQAYKFKNVA